MLDTMCDRFCKFMDFYCIIEILATMSDRFYKFYGLLLFYEVSGIKWR